MVTMNNCLLRRMVMVKEAIIEGTEALHWLKGVVCSFLVKHLLKQGLLNTAVI